MKLYQKEERAVKNALEVIDPTVLLEKASKGLLSLSVELRFEGLRQLMEEEVTELVGNTISLQRTYLFRNLLL